MASQPMNEKVEYVCLLWKIERISGIIAIMYKWKEALEQLLDRYSVDFMRNFNKNFTLCNHKLLSLSMKMLNASVNVK